MYAMHLSQVLHPSNSPACLCRAVLSCVGPYRYYGHPVVRACVEAGTDYLDVCGEPGMLSS